MSTSFTSARFWITAVIILLLGAGAYLFFTYGQSWNEQGEFRAQGVQLLTSTRDPAVLKPKLRGQGVVLMFDDGSWVGLCAGANPVEPAWALSLAVDSEGRLYQCTRSWLPEISRYVIEHDVFGEEEDPTGATRPATAPVGPMAKLAASATLAEARGHLTSMGFTPAAP